MQTKKPIILHKLVLFRDFCAIFLDIRIIFQPTYPDKNCRLYLFAFTFHFNFFPHFLILNSYFNAKGVSIPHFFTLHSYLLLHFYVPYLDIIFNSAPSPSFIFSFKPSSISPRSATAMAELKSFTVFLSAAESA